MKIKVVLVDLSGTLHIENTEIPGSIDAIKRLREKNVNIKFVTNTTKESKRNLLKRLSDIGFAITGDEIFTSLTAARVAVETRGLRPLLLVDERALEDFEGVSVDNPNAVVIGLAPDEFNYHCMNEAFRLLVNGASLVAIHKARYYKRQDGLALGPGPFVEALQFAADVPATVVGKPELSFFTSAVREFDCQPDECVMIGDDARDDIGGAQSCGMLGILVKTGKYRQGDESKIDPPPYRTVDDFSSAIEHIIKHLL
ncbi:haloacid dehalogenase-like hydrolase domain-containing protein 2 [Gigantopelta aegis]|uniref:haloacid dehalogenase-like hydrolase domain-containing protein 2 n=1 Tax=Gigantopelta aegis TaxID=1735272 RepID=UPI001B887569|nr:haloacid dehalogenase-like hydrolase domain-containing protein 2 [Gigantopelta aegis]